MSSGWETKQLDDICAVDWGNTKLTKKSYVPDGDYLAVSAAGCDGRIGHAEHPKHIPVLSAIGARCGRMFFPEQEFTAIKNTITLTPINEQVGGKFLYYLLTSVDLPQRGAGQPFISKGDIQKFVVPLPPLPEQERIVAILDEAFESIDTAIANTEKNLENARELFQSIMHLHVNGPEPGMPAGWSTTTLGEFTTLQRGFDLPSSKRNPGEVPILGSSGVTGWHDESRVAAPGVTVGRSGASFGVASYSEVDFWPLNTAMYVKDFHGNDPRFAYFLLRTFPFKDYNSGSAQPSLNRNFVHPVAVSVPPLSEQRRIAARLDNAHVVVEGIEHGLNTKRTRLNELKLSILQKAFSGELTASADPMLQEAGL